MVAVNGQLADSDAEISKVKSTGRGQVVPPPPPTQNCARWEYLPPSVQRRERDFHSVNFGRCSNAAKRKDHSHEYKETVIYGKDIFEEILAHHSKHWHPHM